MTDAACVQALQGRLSDLATAVGIAARRDAARDLLHLDPAVADAVPMTVDDPVARGRIDAWLADATTGWDVVRLAAGPAPSPDWRRYIVAHAPTACLDREFARWALATAWELFLRRPDVEPTAFAPEILAAFPAIVQELVDGPGARAEAMSQYLETRLADVFATAAVLPDALLAAFPTQVQHLGGITTSRKSEDLHARLQAQQPLLRLVTRCPALSVAWLRTTLDALMHNVGWAVAQGRNELWGHSSLTSADRVAIVAESYFGDTLRDLVKLHPASRRDPAILAALERKRLDDCREYFCGCATTREQFLERFRRLCQRHPQHALRLVEEDLAHWPFFEREDLLLLTTHTDQDIRLAALDVLARLDVTLLPDCDTTRDPAGDTTRDGGPVRPPARPTSPGRARSTRSARS